MPSRRYVVDSNGVDPLVDRPGALDVIEAAVRADRIVLLRTHVLEDELAKAPTARRVLLEQILPLTAPMHTSLFVIGISKIGMAGFGDENDKACLEQLRAGRTDGTHTHDALLTLTARSQSAVVLSADRQMAKRAAALDDPVKVVHPDALLSELGYMAPK